MVPSRLFELALQADLDIIKDYIYDYPQSIDMKEPQSGSTAMHVAASKGNLELISLLHQRGANINIPDMFGNAPIHYAVDRSRNEATILLLNLGANINLQDFRGNSPLHVACTNNDFNMVKLLLKAFAEPALIDLKGMRPIDKTHLPSIKQLIEKQIVANDGGDQEASTQTMNFMTFGIGLG